MTTSANARAILASLRARLEGTEQELADVHAKLGNDVEALLAGRSGAEDHERQVRILQLDADGLRAAIANTEKALVEAEAQERQAHILEERGKLADAIADCKTASEELEKAVDVMKGWMAMVDATAGRAQALGAFLPTDFVAADGRHVAETDRQYLHGEQLENVVRARLSVGRGIGAAVELLQRDLLKRFDMQHGLTQPSAAQPLRASLEFESESAEAARLIAEHRALRELV